MAIDFGKILVAGLVGLVAWNLMSPQERKRFLDDEMAAARREAEERERKRREAQWPNTLSAGLKKRPLLTLTPPAALALSPAISPPVLPAKVSAQPATPIEVVPSDQQWRKVILHPGVVLILGKRGSGKSALGYRLLELFRYRAKPFVVGVPGAARSLLPDWIGMAPTLEEVPRSAIALVDEAYVAYHARGSMAQQSRAMSQLVNLSRQREQTLIFVSQEARQVDKNIASSANTLVFKDLGVLQLAFDRPELNKLAGQARDGFAKLNGDRRRWAYLYAPDTDFVGMLASELPSFWRPSLSRLFAAEATPAPSRAAKTLTAQQKAERARQLRAGGASYQEIADALGVTKGTVTNYLKGYPYRSR